MNWSATAPFLLAAEAANAASDSWALTIANYGVATTMLGWFMWKEKLDRDERKQEKIDMERRHAENLEQQKKVEDAFKTCITSITIAMEGMKSMDRTYADLASKLNNGHP